MQFFQKVSGRTLAGYSPAKLSPGKRWYVVFQATDPDTGKFKRFRISVPPIKSVRERKAYAADMIQSINLALKHGWNPIHETPAVDGQAYIFANACNRYITYIDKCLEDNIMRQRTHDGYMSFLDIFLSWNKKQPVPVNYTYNFTKAVVNDFLDWIWLKQGRKARTRDNYLIWLKTFANFLIEKGLIEENPTEGIRFIQGKKKAEKNRTVIPKEYMLQIHDWCDKHDKYFLLACSVLYYCFIRPKEMSHIKLKDISVKNSTILIREDISKNAKGAVVTIPDCLMKMMIELDVLNNPSDWYLFSDKFRPGKAYHHQKHFGDCWTLKMKKALNLPSEYKFYSLKDTGITDLIENKTDLLSVRDQARHSSLQITDLYTRIENRKANIEVKSWKGSL